MSINKVHMMSLKINVFYFKKKIFPNVDIINILFLIMQRKIECKHIEITLINYNICLYMSYM